MVIVSLHNIFNIVEEYHIVIIIKQHLAITTAGVTWCLEIFIYDQGADTYKCSFATLLVAITVGTHP